MSARAPQASSSTQSPARTIASLTGAVSSILVGKPETVRLAVTALLARGHLLIEDVPGIGKTLLGVALARSVDVTFRRIQFTSDLLPSDVLGVSIYSQRDGRFEFQPGPVFSHVLLADEINRSTPKTQSALLEAMNDLQVTVDGVTRRLPDPFMVLATQNPVEYHGTYPLPEAQLDRFLMRVRIGYPSADDEKRILRDGDPAGKVPALEPVLNGDGVLRLQELAAAVAAAEPILGYIVRLAEATRARKGVRLGLSPRGSLGLARAAKAYALAEDRDYCVPDDVKAVAVPVIAHRLLLDSTLTGVALIEEAEALVEDLLKSVASP